jgi:K+-transporting ATPase KdpF subunit
MTTGDALGLAVTIVLTAYLVYALLRGERL